MTWLWIEESVFLRLSAVFAQRNTTGLFTAIANGTDLVHRHSDTSLAIATGPEIQTWAHVAWRYHRGRLTVFLNGEEAVVTSRSVLHRTNDPVLISSPTSEQGTVVGFNGALDDIKMYSAPLTQDKIRSIARLTPQSSFEISTIHRDNTSITLMWSSASGATYDIEFARTMSGDWSKVGNVTAGESAMFRDSDPARIRQSQGFYRVLRLK